MAVAVGDSAAGGTVSVGTLVGEDWRELCTGSTRPEGSLSVLAFVVGAETGISSIEGESPSEHDAANPARNNARATSDTPRVLTIFRWWTATGGVTWAKIPMLK